LSNVRLHLSSRPENVGLAREVLAGLAETVALSREQYDDMRTAVTEACNNVVQHAYADEGPLEMELRLLRDAVEVVVRDQGIGMSDSAAEATGDLDIGLPVMLALADRLEVGNGPYGGTEVSMRFLAPGVEALDRRASSGREELEANGDGPPEIVLPEMHVSARVAFSNAELATAILPRIAASLAARAHFSTDRVSDVQLVADSIAAGASPMTNGPHLEVALGTGRRRLDMQVGPLRVGGAEELKRRSLPAIERLTDETSVTAIGPDEVLLLRIHDRA
jgi:serine/threonine-protein kinase RsbW